MCIGRINYAMGEQELGLGQNPQHSDLCYLLDQFISVVNGLVLGIELEVLVLQS